MFKKMLSWLFFNTIFVIVIYYSYVGVVGATNTINFLMGFMTIASLCMLPVSDELTEKVKKSYKNTPKWYHEMDIIFDICIILFFSWQGWFWWSGLYLTHTLCSNNIKQRCSLFGK